MLQKKKSFLLLQFSILSLVLYFSGCAEKFEVRVFQKTYYFLDNLESAEIRTTRASFEKVAKTEFVINNDARKVLFEHPNSDVIFRDIPVHENAELKFGMGVNQTAWDKVGDGTTFEIYILDDNAQKVCLFSKYIDPKNNEHDRKWFDENIDLTTFAGHNVSIMFRTSGGPKDNNAADWAGWSIPKLVSYKKRRVSRRMSSHTNVILISIDTLRPDHLGCYGYTRTTSPNLDSLSKHSVLFKNAIAQSDWTLPSHVSLFTSLYPSVHSVTANTKLDSSWTTVTDVLKDNGYLTAGFVDITWLSHKYGLDQGFETYNVHNNDGIAEIGPRVFEFLEENCDEKFFLFVHLFDVHGPYNPPPPYKRMFYSGNEHDPANRSLDFVKELGYHDYLQLDGITDLEYLISAYDGGIAYVDKELGKLFNKLKELNLFDDSLFIITSDHGESLFDRQFWIGHGLFLYDDEVKIPLIIKLPNSAFKGKVIEQQVESIDIAPTILDVLGIPIYKQFQGQSLSLAIKGEKNGSEKKFAFGEASNTGAKFIRNNKWKFISSIVDLESVIKIHLRPTDNFDAKDRFSVGEQLYDLEKDPHEQHNIINQEIEVANELRKELMKWVDANTQYAARFESKPDKVQLTSEELKRLKSLGYVK